MLIHALEQTIQSGAHTFPIYVGFVKAEDLLSVAEVPQFKPDTPNADIASNILTPPVKEWQRPLITDRRDKIIQTFNGTGEFMPNPVLVAERCIGPAPNITISPLIAAGGIPTPIKIIDVPQSPAGTVPPLWIIDGQHRIKGLGDPNCAQRSNFIPVVLLLNNGGNFYNGRNLAKIFAQVTTEATPLDILHKEWLTFAFCLDDYNAGSPQHKAMEAVAILCRLPNNPLTGKVNGFHDDIKFNDKLASAPKYLGHQYDCKDLALIVSDNYYSQNVLAGHLSPQELAAQISMAFDCLKRCVTAPQNQTVFFGDQRHCHKIVLDAYLIGVLAHLCNVAKPPSEADYETLLQKLNFHLTDWNFQQHVVPNSRWVEKSRALAVAVFKEIFRNGNLPANVTNVWDYLSGDQLSVELEFRHVNNNGNAILRNSAKQKFGRGDRKTIPMSQRKYFKVSALSSNAKHIELFDDKSSPSDPIQFRSSGEYLRLPKVDPSKPSQDTLNLVIKCTMYGGIETRMTALLAGWK